jgi:hypothetical protein
MILDSQLQLPLAVQHLNSRILQNEAHGAKYPLAQRVYQLLEMLFISMIRVGYLRRILSKCLVRIVLFLPTHSS